MENELESILADFPSDERDAMLAIISDCGPGQSRTVAHAMRIARKRGCRLTWILIMALTGRVPSRMVADRLIQRSLPRPMLGDIVRPFPHAGPLASGCSRYEDAIVVRVNPFAVVSRGADMIWSCTVDRSDFLPVGRADSGLFERCLNRLTYGLSNRPVKRMKATVRRRNRRDLRGQPGLSPE